MSDFIFGAIELDAKHLQRVPLMMSADMHARGRKHINQSSGGDITDAQMAMASLVAPSVLPSSFFLSMPPVANQGSEGSCVSFMAAYYMRSCEQYYSSGAGSYSTSTNVFSPEFTFNQVSGINCTASSVFSTFDLMKNSGVCLWDTMPYTWTGCDIQPNATQYAEAANYKIPGYYTIPASDIIAMKTRLLQGHALGFISSVDENFYYANGEVIWKTYGTALGVHAITICGYDDAKHAWKVINSFGTSWGDAGFIWIDYDFFPQKVATAVFTIGDAPASNTAPTANAGIDQSISGSSVLLDGTGSKDPDGYLKAYSWSQTSGPNTAVLTNATSAVCSASGLVAGSYTFRLTVTDDGDSTASDSCVVLVQSPETLSLNGVKSGRKHVLNWSLSLNSAAQAIILEVNSGLGYTTLYTTSSTSGSYTNSSLVKKKTYTYRIKVQKTNGTVAYSNTVSITA
jgi:C1A family cysteine protease